MSEFVTVQVGQCGNQIGSTLWPLVLQEYGIMNVPNGIIRENSSNLTKTFKISDTFHSFFMISEKYGLPDSLKFSDLVKCDVKARAVLIDMEDSVLNRFHTGPLRNLFDKECTVKNYPGSGNNWAEGYFTHGTKYQDNIEKVLRQTVEKCNSLHGFLVMFSAGGGTGSGLGSFTLEMLEDLYPNIERFVTCIYPNGTEDVITCPYNAALTTHSLVEHASCVFPVENRALLDLVNQQRKQNCADTNNYIVKCRPFQDMNSIVVNMLLHLTCGSRFSGNLNVDMNDISTNLIPFPKLQFLSSSVSPITISDDRNYRQLTGQKIRNEIFINSCHRKSQLLKIDPLGLNSFLVGAALIGRGDFTISDMRDYVQRLQSRDRFTPWSRQSVRVGLCSTSSAGHRSSMLSLFNTSAICEFYDQLLGNFNKLYRRKAHVHHYTQVNGFEREAFEECRNTLLDSTNSYAVLNTEIKEEPRYKVI